MTGPLVRRLGAGLGLVVLTLTLASCGDHEDAGAAMSEKTSAAGFEADPSTYPDGKDSYPDLGPGDCFDHPALARAFDDGDFSEVTPVGLSGVACSEPHDFELYELAPIAGEDYPGEARIDRLARRGCAAAFRTFVGVDPSDSTLDFYYATPSLGQWRASEDDRAHAATCVVYQRGEQTTGSLGGSRH